MQLTSAIFEIMSPAPSVVLRAYRQICAGSLEVRLGPLIAATKAFNVGGGSGSEEKEKTKKPAYDSATLTCYYTSLRDLWEGHKIFAEITRQMFVAHDYHGEINEIADAMDEKTECSLSGRAVTEFRRVVFDKFADHFP